MTILHKQQYIHCGDLGEGYNVAAEKVKKQFYKSNTKSDGFFLFYFVIALKRSGSEVIQYSPGGRMLLLLELDNVSSSGIFGTVVSFRPDVVGSSMHGAFIFGGSASVLSQARLLAFFGL